MSLAPGAAAPAPSGAEAAARRSEQNERLLAFAFAGADMLVETDAAGQIVYAAGAFSSRFGRPPEAFIGQPLRTLVATAEHETLAAALAQLVERGRLQPMLLRLADTQRTRLALAGMALPRVGLSPRLCLTFARPPTPLAAGAGGATPHGLARAAEARLRAGDAGDFGLLDLTAVGGGTAPSREQVGAALDQLAPDAVASEIAPGRFGLLGGGTQSDLLAVAGLLEKALLTQGLAVNVAARQLPLDAAELTPTQAARALRQALNVFARDGVAGLDSGDFAGGLSGYMRRARTQTASLRKAIRGNRFTLLYQPIVSLADRVVHHYEALIRPQTIADCPSANAQEFVMLVEAIGIADELDLAVAHMACDAAAKAGRSVAFNLSGQSVQSSGFRDRLLSLLQAHPARQAGLVLVEMTETAELEDIDEAARTATALRSLGVPFCLDDFGAGAADIRALRALNPDVVKLDGSYVPGVATEGRERALVAGMVEIARSGGAEIVAERVETEGEAAALLALGVHHGQGWLFGKPAPLPVSAAKATARARRTGEKESWG